MLLIALDTSTSAITVALHDGDRVVAHCTTLDARAHAEHVAPNIRAALAEAGATPADLTHIVCGVGPGPFTGLRVGIVTAATLGLALDVPVHGLCSLDALAHAVWLDGRRGPVLVATDARRKEVYSAVYALDDHSAHRVREPSVARAADLPEAERSLGSVGRGALLYPDALTRLAGLGDGSALDVSGASLADLAVRRVRTAGPFDGVAPLYLRHPDAAPAAGVVKSALG